MFSFVGRCQGECGSAKNTRVPVSSANWVGPLLPTVPSERPAEVLGQPSHRHRQPGIHRDGPIAAERRTVLHRWFLAPALKPGQMHQERGPAAPLDERADCGPTSPDDQIPFLTLLLWVISGLS